MQPGRVLVLRLSTERHWITSKECLKGGRSPARIWPGRAVSCNRMINFKNLIAPVAIVCSFLLNVSLLHADDSDIFGRNVQPNVLFLLDSSGSMAEEVPSNPYPPATTYAVQNACRVNNRDSQ